MITPLCRLIVHEYSLFTREPPRSQVALKADPFSPRSLRGLISTRLRAVANSYNQACRSTSPSGDNKLSQKENRATRDKSKVMFGAKKGEGRGDSEELSLRPLCLGGEGGARESDATSLNDGAVTSPLTETVWLSPISESVREIDDSSVASDFVDDEEEAAVDNEYESTGEL